MYLTNPLPLSDLDALRNRLTPEDRQKLDEAHEFGVIDVMAFWQRRTQMEKNNGTTR
jgi:hypothetical protein